VQNRCINRPTHLELINVPFPGFTDDFVQTFPARRKDVESKKERGYESREKRRKRSKRKFGTVSAKKVQILAYEHAPK